MREDGVVRIEKGQAGYSELLGEIAADLLEQIALNDQQKVRVEGALKELAKAHPPLGDGEVSTVIANTYFDFKVVLFASLKIAAKAALAIYTSEVVGGIDAAISALEMACTRFSRLENEEVVTYWALVQLERADTAESRRASGFTSQEIISEIEKTSSITSEENINAGLQHLTEMGVTNKIGSGGYIVAERWVK